MPPILEKTIICIFCMFGENLVKYKMMAVSEVLINVVMVFITLVNPFFLCLRSLQTHSFRNGLFTPWKSHNIITFEGSKWPYVESQAKREFYGP